MMRIAAHVPKGCLIDAAIQLPGLPGVLVGGHLVSMSTRLGNHTLFTQKYVL